MRYASRTKVPVDRSRVEIERTLMRYGADQFAVALDREASRAAIQFRLERVLLRFEMAVPKDERGARQRWRALHLAIKAKLEAVESEIETFEQAWMAYIVLPNGQTAGEHLGPRIKAAIDKGTLPQNLLEWHPNAGEK